MPEFQLTRKAVKDLSMIWDYTFDNWSERQADHYYQMILDSCREISEDPSIGKNYKGIVSQLSGYKVGKHIIFYRKMKSDEIEITRILHEQMDLEKRILE